MTTGDRYDLQRFVAAQEPVFETVLAKYLLKEQVGWKRWAGAGLVACGVALLSF